MRRLFVSVCMVAVVVFTTSTAEAKKPKVTIENPVIVRMTLSGEYPEGPAAPGMFGELEPSLAKVVERLDAAAKDKNVKAVWLKLENLEIGRGKIFELRGAVERLRKAKKLVFAELTTADAPEYLVATACDQIVMPQSGILMVPGVHVEVIFFKGLLDKIGVKFDALKMGKFKGAAEPLTRNKMSKPLRESYESLVDDLYGNMVSMIAADRHLEDYQVKTHLDRGVFTAADAVKANLIDEVLYSDQLEEAIKKQLKIDDIKVVTNYKTKHVEIELSGFSGMMKLFELLTVGKPSKPVGKKPRIAVVYAVGQIVEGKSKDEMFSASVMGSTTIVAALKKAAKDPKVSAIVLRIDSPGGSAVASDLIWRETQKLGKPMIASMGDVAGSGGYYIAMGAKKIYAAPGTLTGSIGVIGGKLVAGGLFDKLGLKTETISRGANSGAMSITKPFTPEERKVWLETLSETYRQFVGKAAEGRKMTFDKLEALAQGRVYTGVTAKKLGLIDELGTLDDAIVAAKLSAGLKGDADVDLLVLPEAKTFFEQLFGDPSASTDLDALLPDGLELLRQAATLRAVLSQKVLTWMPYGVRVK